ncbi:MAG: hypothetical protein KA171_09260 [Reyranella sp.]|nr:hypothetical protein [Reyranella sp.]
MIRIALLGNSHLYSWKRAWNSLGRAYPDVDLVFFAARGAQLECCEPQGDRLVFKREDIARWIEVTSGGRRELVAADYDALCVVGLGYGVRSVTALYSGWRTDSHTGKEGRFQLVSDACFLDAVGDRLKASLAMTVVGRLRQITDKVIWLAPTPAPSEVILTLNDLPEGIEIAAAAPDAPSLRATYDEACRRLTAENLILLEQPKATLASPLLSKNEYRLWSWKTTDWYHWNDAYGRIVIRDFLSRLHPSLDGQGACDSSGRLLRLADPLLGALRNTLFHMSIRRSPKG